MDIYKKTALVVGLTTVIAACGGGSDENTSQFKFISSFISSPAPIAAPAVSSVTATNPTIAVATMFTVTGSNLKQNLTVSVEDCSGLETKSQTDTQILVQCTPQSFGKREIVVKDKDSKQLFSSSVIFEQPVTTYAVTGVAAKGLIRNGIVTAYKLTSSGKGSKLTTTRTNANGEYRLDLDSNWQGMLLIEVTSDDKTTMFCDASTCDNNGSVAKFGDSVKIASDFMMRAATPISYGVDGVAAITPLTEIAWQSLEKNTSINNSKVLNTYYQVAESLGISDVNILTTLPSALGIGKNAAVESENYALMAAAFAQIASRDNKSIKQVINEFAADFSANGGQFVYAKSGSSTTVASLVDAAVTVGKLTPETQDNANTLSIVKQYAIEKGEQKTNATGELTPKPSFVLNPMQLDGIGATGDKTIVDGVNGSKALKFSNRQMLRIPNRPELQFNEGATFDMNVRIDGDVGMDGYGRTVTGTWAMSLIAKSHDRTGFALMAYRAKNGVGAGGFATYEWGNWGNNEWGNDWGCVEVAEIPAIPLGEWFRMTAVVSKTSGTAVYVNKQLASVCPHAKTDFTVANTQDMYLGIYSDKFWYPLDGSIGNLKVYQKALSAADVKNLDGVTITKPADPVPLRPILGTIRDLDPSCYGKVTVTPARGLGIKSILNSSEPFDIHEYDEIRTTADCSVASLYFVDHSIVRISANTTLNLQSASSIPTNQQIIDTKLSRAELWGRVFKPISDNTFFNVSTEESSIGVRG